MESNYLIWERDIVDGACSLESLKGFEDDWQLRAGMELSRTFPATAAFHFDPDDPTGLGLTDSLYNANRVIVASPRLRRVIEQANVPLVEFLPVAVYNHKKRAIAEPYCIVNPLQPVDCLVVDACEPQWGRIDKKNISRLKRFVIDEARIDPARRLFRVTYYRPAIVVHRELAEAIDAAGVTGTRWIELTDYPEV